MEGRTTFVIAHRLSTLRSATKILVVNEGRIVERGTHMELLERDGLYRMLWDYQNRRDVEFSGNGQPGVEEARAAGDGRESAERAVRNTQGPYEDENIEGDRIVYGDSQ
jgi:ABC-type multidrug transport system ATPase subunit